MVSPRKPSKVHYAWDAATSVNVLELRTNKVCWHADSTLTSNLIFSWVSGGLRGMDVPPNLHQIGEQSGVAVSFRANSSAAVRHGRSGLRLNVLTQFSWVREESLWITVFGSEHYWKRPIRKNPIRKKKHIILSLLTLRLWWMLFSLVTFEIIGRVYWGWWATRLVNHELTAVHAHSFCQYSARVHKAILTLIQSFAHIACAELEYFVPENMFPE